jgi:hypothetical protein
MPASNRFVDQTLDIIHKHITQLGGNNQDKLDLVNDICSLPAGNQSVRLTLVRLAAAAHQRWDI